MTPRERLASVSNAVFRVDDRVVRSATRARIGVDHAVEAANAIVAAEHGIGPAVLEVGLDGALVTALVPGHALTPSEVRGDRVLVTRTGQLLRRLHDGPELAGRFDPYALILELRSALVRTQAIDTDAWAICKSILGHVPVVTAPALAPCHNDPWPGNFIAGDGGRLWLVDWEYSGMGDPMWDLADLSVEADLDDVGDEVLLDAHGDGDLDRFRAYKILSDVLWSLWSLAEHVAGNDADDFVAEAARRAARACGALNR